MKIKKLLSPEEFSAALSKVEKPRDHLLFSLLWELALRISEALHIRVEHLDLDKRTVRIFQQKKRGEAERFLPISEGLAQRLRYYTVSQKQGLIFGIGRAQAFNLCKRYFGVNPHALRHSRAVDLLTNGRVNIETLRRLLGHSRLDMTQQYLDFDFETLRQDLERAQKVMPYKPPQEAGAGLPGSGRPNG